MPELDLQYYPTWIERHNAAAARYEEAEKERKRAIFGFAGKEAIEEADTAAQEAWQDSSKVMFDAAEDFIHMLRKAAILHPEELRDLMLEVLGDSIVEAVLEGSR